MVDRIRVPTLILHATDDPFVRLTAETREKVLENPQITLIETEHGGHCAFLEEPDAAASYDGYWAEHRLLRFVLEHGPAAVSEAGDVVAGLISQPGR